MFQLSGGVHRPSWMQGRGRRGQRVGCRPSSLGDVFYQRVNSAVDVTTNVEVATQTFEDTFSSNFVVDAAALATCLGGVLLPVHNDFSSKSCGFGYQSLTKGVM